MSERVVGSIASDVTSTGIPKEKQKHTVLSKAQIELICAVAEANFDFAEEHREGRPPIITIMGHVDHGKTTLVDALRHSNLAAHEYGEVTQSIGAFSLVTRDRKYITVIDTPGHEVFVKMRSRGALATDLIVLVVSAAEGVQRQTEEVIKLAADSDVPIIVALNKIDRADSDPDKVLLELAERNVVVPELGGEIPYIPISAKKGTNLDKLVTLIQSRASKLDLTECTNIKPQGFVIESEVTKSGRNVGVTSSLIVMRGVLTAESYFVCGKTSGRVRYMKDDFGTPVKRATAGKAVHMSGFKETPQPGSLLHVVDSEKQAAMITFVKGKLKDLSQEKPVRLFTPEGTDDVSKLEDEKMRAMPIVIKVSRSGILETIMDEITEKIRGGTRARHKIARQDLHSEHRCGEHHGRRREDGTRYQGGDIWVRGRLPEQRGRPRCHHGCAHQDP